MTVLRYFRLPAGLLLLVIAGFEWYAYIGYGIAYGSLVGLVGKENVLGEIGYLALRAFSLALGCEAFAVGLISWPLLAPERPTRARLLIAVLIMVGLDFATYVLVRGI
jgi:hypothetical protein